MKNLKHINSKHILIMVIGLISCIMFFENFIASSSFSILYLRTIDDIGFQYILNKYYHLKGLDLLLMNDYGYGWVYWFPMYVLTYPAYLIKQYLGVEWLLIVLPRMQSLVFSVGCSILMYKITCVYTKNHWARVVAVLCTPIYPIGCYYAGRFGTVAQTAFFSMLAVYLVIREEELDSKSLRKALIAFAIALATKVSVIAVAPLLVLLVLARYHWKISLKNIQIWVKEVVFAVVVFLLLLSPAIVFAPLNMENAKESIDILQYYMLRNQVKSDFIINCKEFLTYTMSIEMFILFLIGLFIATIQDLKEAKNNRKWDFLCMLFGYCTGTFYLCYSIPTGASYIFIYATSFSFVISLGIIGYTRIKGNKLGKKIIICICILMIVMQGIKIIDISKKRETIDPLAYYKSWNENREKISEIQQLREYMLPIIKERESYCLIDYLGPMEFISSLERNSTVTENVIWDNLAEWDMSDTDFIVLAKQSRGFLPQQEFDKEVNDMDEGNKKIAIKDREMRQNLIHNEVINEKSMKKIYESDWIYVYVDEDWYHQGIK